MALAFFNVKSRERRIAESEPMIAALLNSSDRNPNSLQGQDFGWRLAPETKVELERIKKDQSTLSTIAATFGILLENVSESDILNYISTRGTGSTGQSMSEDDFSSEYEEEIRRLQSERKQEEEENAKIKADQAKKSDDSKPKKKES